MQIGYLTLFDVFVIRSADALQLRNDESAVRDGQEDET
jgi:hypothetical protein